MTRMRWALVVLGALFVLFALLFWFGQRSLMYFPDRTPVGSAQSLPGGEDVVLTTSDGLSLHAWQLNPSTSDRGMAVLYLPGNGGNRAGRAGVGQALAGEGFTVLLLDYRGYGGNPGSPSETGLVRDAEAALDHLAAQGFPADRTIYVGESVGTGVAAKLAEAHPPAGVLLRSPFTSMPDVASSDYGIPLGWALRDHFDTLSRMPRITSEVTVLYGLADSLIPPEQSQAVADAAPRLHEVVALSGVDHNDSIWFGTFVAERVASLAAAPGR